MEMHASRIIAADRAAVWAALNSAEVLKECIPGCEELTGSPAEGFAATVKQKVGPVKATFKGAVTLSDIEPGVGCRLQGEGKGGAAGFAKGGALVLAGFVVLGIGIVSRRRRMKEEEEFNEQEEVG